MSSERDAELQRKHAQSVSKLLDAAFPGVGVGQVFQTQVEAAQRRGSVTAAVIGSDFEGWWEAEGDTTLFRALANNDGDIMKCGRMIARMAWLRGALTAAELDRAREADEIRMAQENAYADAEAKAQAERGEVVP
jgi:hypothetical protein